MIWTSTSFLVIFPKFTYFLPLILPKYIESFKFEAWYMNQLNAHVTSCNVFV
jgi:uncharacterized membrane protein